MTAILQSQLPEAPWMAAHTRRMPGTLPLNMTDWLRVDDAYAAQMAERDRLIRDHGPLVHGMTARARGAADEAYALILPMLPALGFDMRDGGMRRPDGVVVPLDERLPLLTLGRLIQEDLCIMQEDGEGEHLLSAAILCFPAGWLLAEKLGRPMMRIHQPVVKYTADVGRRVQRLMDMVRPGAPMWRMNAHYSDAPLFNPLAESSHDRHEGAEAVLATDKPYIRAERQSLIRLAVTGAVVFSIHTYVVRRQDLTPEQAAGLAAHPIHMSR